MPNKYISPFDRDFDSITQRVLEGMPQHTPEITDKSLGNPLIQILYIYAGIMEQIGYYLDEYAKEANLSTAELWTSIVQHSLARDYRNKGAMPAYAVVTFSLNQAHSADITIPQGTFVRTEDVIFETLETVSISAEQLNVEVPCIQREQYTKSFFSDGRSSQYFELEENVIDEEVSVIVGSIAWDNIDSFAFANSDTECFVSRLNMKRNYEIAFGDGNFGKIPENGVEITIHYFRTQGTKGNVPALAINELITNISLPDHIRLSVSNRLPAVNGTDAESIEKARKNATMFVRAVMGATHPNQFGILAQSINGIKSASVLFTAGATETIIVDGVSIVKNKPVEIFIATEDNESPSQVFIDLVSKQIKSVTTTNIEIVVKPSGTIYVDLFVKVSLRRGFVKSDAEIAINNAVEAFFNNTEINSTLFLSDIYEILEAVPAVANSFISQVVMYPYAHPINSQTLNTLLWNATMKAVTQVASFEIHFLGSENFELRQGDTLVGTYSIDEQISLPEVEMRVFANSYLNGDAYIFNVYPSVIQYANVKLVEPSVFRLRTITIEA